MFFFVNFNYFKKEIKNLYIMLVDFKSIIWYTKLLSKDIEKLEKYMKTLILNGSPKKNGNTAALINLLTENLTGVYMITNAFESNISPCIDCGYCRKNGVCAVNDDMSGVYEYIKDCDNIVIASPIYFSELTGPLLSVCSRFQAFYCSRRYLNTEPIDTGKKGGIILVGGGDGSFDTAEKTAGILLRQMGADTFFPPIVSHNTDIIPASEDQSAADDILKLADFFIAPTISCDKSNRGS